MAEGDTNYSGVVGQGGTQHMGGVGNSYGGQGNTLNTTVTNIFGYVPPQPLLPGVPPFFVPYSPRCFGREAVLVGLERALAPDSSGQPVVVTTAGVGGVGKTFLAATFAHQMRGKYAGGIFWVSMAQAESVATQVASFGDVDGLHIAGYAAMDTPTRARAVQAVWAGDTARLLIFDNCEDPALLDAWLPKAGGCQVLLTSRNARWGGGVRVVALDTLARGAATELLCTAVAERRKVAVAVLMAERAADAVCARLGDLPLAVALAGVYVAENAFALDIAGYLALLDGRANVLEDVSLTQLARETTHTRHLPHVAASFALSYEQLVKGRRTKAAKERDGAARRLVYRLAVCAPVAIPRRLVWRLAGADPDAVAARLRAEGAIGRLCQLGLVKEEEDGSLTMHRLMAAYLRGEGGDPNDLDAVMLALGWEVYPILKAGYPKGGAAYLPHLEWLADGDRLPDSELAATLLTNYGYLLHMAGDYAKVRPLHERALAIAEKNLGENHPQTAGSLNNLALYRALGDYAAALPLYTRVSAIRESVLGANHLDTATSLNNLALLYKAQGDYERALPLLERALTIRGRCLAKSIPIPPRASTIWRGCTRHRATLPPPCLSSSGR